jgi:hypothetical protein
MEAVRRERALALRPVVGNAREYRPASGGILERGFKRYHGAASSPRNGASRQFASGRWEAIATESTQDVSLEPLDIRARLCLVRRTKEVLAAEFGEQLGRSTRAQPVKGSHLAGETEVGELGRGADATAIFAVGRSLTD